MQVILLTKNQLGNIGDAVNVKAGFARNYLFPKHLAAAATKENIAKLAEHRAELEKQANELLKSAQARAESLNQLEVVIIHANAGEEGKLFGSIGTRDIATAITEAGVLVEKKEVNLPEGALRHLGEFSVDIRLHSDVSVMVKLSVIPEA